MYDSDSDDENDNNWFLNGLKKCIQKKDINNDDKNNFNIHLEQYHCENHFLYDIKTFYLDSNNMPRVKYILNNISYHNNYTNFGKFTQYYGNVSGYYYFHKDNDFENLKEESYYYYHNKQDISLSYFRKIKSEYDEDKKLLFFHKNYK